jgi:hypothetical protein
MVTNPLDQPHHRPWWCLLAIYAAGYAGGRDAATMARLNHPACHGNLKP